jgi:hypothetical protein
MVFQAMMPELHIQMLIDDTLDESFMSFVEILEPADAEFTVWCGKSLVATIHDGGARMTVK